MATTHAPFSFHKPYTPHLEPLNIEGQAPVYQTDDSLPALTDLVSVVWRELEPKLSELPAKLDRHGWNADFALPARIEFLETEGPFGTRGVDGALIFDSRGKLIVHVVPARLGYGHWGGGLSEDIMRLLGVPDEMIADIQLQLRDQPLYAVVVSREKIKVDGYVVADHGLAVAPEWMWWRDQ